MPCSGDGGREELGTGDGGGGEGSACGSKDGDAEGLAEV